MLYALVSMVNKKAFGGSGLGNSPTTQRGNCRERGSFSPFFGRTVGDHGHLTDKWPRVLKPASLLRSASRGDLPFLIEEHAATETQLNPLGIASLC